MQNRHITTEDIIEIQNVLEVPETGEWDAQTSNAYQSFCYTKNYAPGFCQTQPQYTDSLPKELIDLLEGNEDLEAAQKRADAAEEAAIAQEKAAAAERDAAEKEAETSRLEQAATVARVAEEEAKLKAEEDLKNAVLPTKIVTVSDNGKVVKK